MLNVLGLRLKLDLIFFYFFVKYGNLVLIVSMKFWYIFLYSWLNVDYFYFGSYVVCSDSFCFLIW